MKKAIPKTLGGKRPGAGRPATGKDPVRTMRLSDEFIAKVDGWALQQGDRPARSEAIRRLVELGLTLRTIASPSQRLGAARAQDLATKAIEKIIDPAAPPPSLDIRRRRPSSGFSVIGNKRRGDGKADKAWPRRHSNNRANRLKIVVAKSRRVKAKRE